MSSKRDCIVIIDFGSQYTQLIARRIRELGSYCEVYASYHSSDFFQTLASKHRLCGVILSGSHASVEEGREESFFSVIEWFVNKQIPILGVCYGMQLINHYFGGKVEQTDQHEYGLSHLKAFKQATTHPLTQGFFDLDSQKPHKVWMSHADQITHMSKAFNTLASTETCPVAIFTHQTQPIFGLQFHPEVTHTDKGSVLLKNFVFNICKTQANWKMSLVASEMIIQLREKIGKKKVLLALSGGVDSSVVAMLLHQAIEAQLKAVFIDNGLLRLNEAQEVEQTFKNIGLDLETIDAKEAFFKALSNQTEPEKKRQVIGHTFIEVFQKAAKTLSQDEHIPYLAQGTIYPDVIESAKSATQQATTIKTHHNVGGLPEDMPFELIEPLRDLFKDEVRKLGLQLGLPPALIHRHPFPGPGLAVRILGEVNEKRCHLLQKVDNILMTELKKSGWYEKTSQAFAVLLPVKSVGVVGDGRRYGQVVALRAVQTTDFMTAHVAPLPWDLLEIISNKIINEVPQISRVTYDFSSKPPATIEWE